MPTSKKNISVLLPLSMPGAFTYSVPENIEITNGDVVSVPFGRKTEIGIAWGVPTETLPENKIKAIYKKPGSVNLSGDFRKFIDWVASYTMSPPGSVLKMALSGAEDFEDEDGVVVYARHCEEHGDAAIHNRDNGLPRFARNDVKTTKSHQKIFDALAGGELSLREIKEKSGAGSAAIKKMAADGLLVATHKPKIYKPETIHPTHINLSESQTEIANILIEKAKANIFSASLLDGVTGSGKTEVYLSAVEEIFKDETAQVLILLPEIALTSQVVNRFERRFGFKPQTWHSGMTKSARTKAWNAVAHGGTRMVIGARSALFLPFNNLKIIIVDEEHDSSYKQEEGVIYNARDMAVLRAKIENLPIVLASATPSIETMENVKSGKYEWLHLPLRHGGATMPGVSIIDMRTQKLDSKHFLAPPLVAAIRENIANGQQSLLFLNRRGYAPLVLCRTCGYRFKCGECSTWLVSHKNGGYLMCHHCGFRQAQPKNCPECNNEDTLAACGPGVERIEEEVREYFPEANIALMASDSLTNAKMEELLGDILNGKVDIIIGTQVIAKGHHFPNLTLVGVVDGDLGLEGGDLRAAERTYQLLHQVAGRAGREGLKGRVILQSYMPDNNVMQALRSWDRDGFINAEMLSRQQNSMPPFTRFAALIISGAEEAAVSGIARQIVNGAPKHNDIKVLGPVPAPIFMLRGKFRYRILIKSARNINIQSWMKQALANVKIPGNVKVKIDIDPYSFL